MKLVALMVAAATGVSVALSGGIVFVGMIVPHLIRLAAGPDHRFLLPASALLGGSLLVAADMITRLPVTRIVISHRPALIERADRVYRLEGGKLTLAEERKAERVR